MWTFNKEPQSKVIAQSLFSFENNKELILYYYFYMLLNIFL